MSNKKDKSKLLQVLKIFVYMFIILMMIIGSFIIYKANKTHNIFKNIEDEAELTEYIVYGTHLNIRGNLTVTNLNIKNINLYFKTINDNYNKEYKLNYNKKRKSN